MFTSLSLASYWSTSIVAANAFIFLNLLGALLLGLIVGYERAYHGRAAGMRTYGMVCMASTALTLIAGHPEFWFGAHGGFLANADPTKVIQGIVTGIGFLGAGIIMKDGTNISGLTSAASIWASSAIGIMVGVGFYLAAILLALISVLCMMYVVRLETWLPSHHVIAVMLRYKVGFNPQIQTFHHLISAHQYGIEKDSLAITQQGNQTEWHLKIVNLTGNKSESIAGLSDQLKLIEGIEDFQLTYSHN